MLQGENEVNEVNEHWAPFNMHCNFCQIDYSLVGRMERFEEYLSFIVDKENPTNRIPKDVSNFHLHPSGIQTVSSKHYVSRYNKVSDYFSTLSEAQLFKLSKMYKIDFEMFGYDENEYLQGV